MGSCVWCENTFDGSGDECPQCTNMNQEQKDHVGFCTDMRGIFK